MSTPNPALWWVVGGALVFLAVVIYVPFVRDLFGFASLHFIDLVICFMAGIASVLWFEGLKIFNGRNRHHS
jgi:Ca2+-transporting ATPase